MLLEATDIWKTYGSGARRVAAVAGVSFAVDAGETLAIVGESGSGKTTLGRCVLRLVEPDAGSIFFRGRDLRSLPARELRAARRDFQTVFQDPLASVNPRMRIGEIVEEPLLLHTTLRASERLAEVDRLLSMVHLSSGTARRYPHQLSGGQLQRVGIARAVATSPGLLVLDEPTSSLDVSVRGGILKLLRVIQEERGTAFIFISHDLVTVRGLADRVSVMYRGRIVETGGADEIFSQPQHPYTQTLLSAVLPLRPHGRRGRFASVDETSTAGGSHEGCIFASRCPIRIDRCDRVAPPFVSVGGTHDVACLRVEDGTNLIPEHTRLVARRSRDD